MSLTTLNNNLRTKRFALANELYQVVNITCQQELHIHVRILPTPFQVLRSRCQQPTPDFLRLRDVPQHVYKSHSGII
jgi:hypothetical protein